MQIGGYSGVDEAAGVVDVLVEQAIEVPDRDERRGQTGEIIGARRDGVA